MKNVKTGHTCPIVCLDAGHYGKYNRSPAVSSYYESDMNWKLHLLLKSELESYGISVITTRSDKDKDLGLSARGKVSKGCNLFLSIHSNAVGSDVNESVDYPLVCVQLDGNGDVLGNMLAKVIEETMGTVQPGRIYKRKGINGEYYGVLRGASAVGTMGMILEHSFHTNTRSTKWLSDDKNLANMAKAEAAVIAEWFGVSKEKQKGMVNMNVPVLKKGSKGSSVKALQALLIGYVYKMENNGTVYGVDGSFGGATDKAVRAYQKANGLEVDGIVGPATWSKLLGV